MSEENDKPSAVIAENAASRDGGGPEHSAKAAENQEQKPDAAALLQRRIRDIEHLLIEKEAYQMAFVFQKIPKPYYNQWKSEANEIIALIVALKHRAASFKKRKAG